MNVLKVENLKKGFNNTEVIKDISFTLEKGEILSIIGPSGSGKSTILRCITQLEKADSGTIIIDGQTLCSDKNGTMIRPDKAKCRAIGLKTGLVFQNFNLFPHLSVIENIMEAQIAVLKLDKKTARENSLRLLKQMALEDKSDAYPYQLSGGQQQRVSIARALALKPWILFFDEPTSALDPELTGEILEVIKKLKQTDISMVIVTHEMAFARDVSDKVIFIDKGVIIEQGNSKEVFDKPKTERAKKFLSRYSMI